MPSAIPIPRLGRARRAALALSAIALLGAAAAPAEARIPNDPQFINQYALNNTGQTIGGVAGTPDADIDAPEAWDLTTGSSAVTVAMVDDGIDPLQRDLAPNVDLAAGYDFGEGDTDATQQESAHGTQTAAILGGRGDDGLGMAGVAWNVRIVPLKVRKACPVTTSRVKCISTAAEAAAYRYANQIGARVVNASFGALDRRSDDVLAAITAATNTLFVVSAGNSRANNDRAPRYPCNYTVPNLICVGGTDRDDKLWIESNYGPTSVQIAAPALRVYTTSGTRYGPADGTSFSAPMVSGAAALYWAKYPTATVADVRNALLSGVDVLPSLAGKIATSGRLNVARTLSIPPQGDPPPPPPPPPPGSPYAVAAITASRNDGNVPANAIDGSLATRWGENGDGQWLRLDLAGPVTVHDVQVAGYRGDTRKAKFDIQTSPDGTTWTTIGSFQSSGTTRNLETYDVPDTTARYVRYLGHGFVGGLYNGVTEIAVR
jgi:subtilisin family serine protease